MKTTRSLALLLTAALATPVFAQPAPTTTPTGGDTAPGGQDDALYSCKKKSGMVAVTFKPETELKDLIAWAMGFTCKNFLLDPRIVSTGKKVTVIAPNKMSAAEAYTLFLASLSTMGLTVVPKGNVLRIVESAIRDHVAARLPSTGIAEFHPDAAYDAATPARLVPYLRRSPDPLLQLVPLELLDRVRAHTAVVDLTDQAQMLTGLAQLPRGDIADTIAEDNHARVTADAAAIAATLEDIAADRRRTYASVGIAIR